MYYQVRFYNSKTTSPEYLLQEKFSPDGEWITRIKLENLEELKLAESLWDYGFSFEKIEAILMMELY